jgi:serine/threonine-protein kinase
MAAWATQMQFGPYVLIAPAGAGGMGEVWKARDTRLDRIVALKRLKAEHSARFEPEARAIAALNHPHICALYDIGPDYLVMEYVEGAPVSGPMPVERALKLAIQIASALEEAHGKGILHRDLKPSNILVTAKGAAKLFDFGLAKLVADSDATQTMADALMGTPMYMAPEQAEGKPADRRSDVFGFGAVLYEMLAGRRAFDSLATVVRDTPKPLDAPAEVARIVTRCLAKSPAERFQSMTDLKAALERASTLPAERQPSIAVLPFANMSRDPDDEYFSDGLAEEIMNTLAHLPGLKVTARTSAFAFRGKEQDIRKIAEALNVRTVLEGSVRRSGSRIRVTAQLVNAEDGYHLWSERYDREMADVFAMQDEIAAAIAKALEVKLVGRPATRRAHQPNLEAYEAFLRGRHEILKLAPDSAARGKQLLEQAIALDPAFSEPHAELGHYHLLQGTWGLRSVRETMPAARAHAERALELSPVDSRAHAALCWVAGLYDYNWKEAGEQYRLAMAAEHVPAEVRVRCATNYLCPLGRVQEAIEQVERAVEQDPLNAFVRGAFALVLSLGEAYDRALIEGQKAMEMDPNHWLPHFAISLSHALRGEFAAARPFAERSAQAAPWYAPLLGLLAGILARLGEKEGADELVTRLRDMRPAGLLTYHSLCSGTDTTADWLAKMIEDHEPLAATLSCLKPIRSSPRWPALAKMMNLPVEAT